MQIRGKVIKIGQVYNGTRKSDGSPWKKQEFVIETEGQYHTKVAFSVMNDKIDRAAIQLGQTLEIEVDAQSREYKDRWYTELTAWRINNLGFAQPSQPVYGQPVYQQQAPQGYAPTVTPVNQFGQPLQQGVSNDMPF